MGLEERLGYRFARPALLEQALTHSSYGANDNERLEFLGDGVLGCAVAEELFQRFPQLPEGRLTRFRSALVRQETLAALAEAIGIRDRMRIGSQVQFTPAILADAVEAIFGAVFVDGGYSAARAAVARVYAERLQQLDPESDLRDAKSRLNERMQAEGKKAPEYRLLQAHGPDNDRTFEVVCAIPELRLEASGTGTSLQRAQQRAAAAMLEKLAT